MNIENFDTSELDKAGLAPIEGEKSESPQAQAARMEELGKKFDLSEAKETSVEGLSKSELQQELRRLNEEQRELGETYRGNAIWETVPPHSDLSKYDEDTKGRVRALNDEYNTNNSALQSKINSLAEKLEEMNLNETEAEVDAYIKANPARRTLDEVRAFSERKRFSDGGLYSSGDEIMSDVHVVLASELKNDEKIAIINALSGHIESSTIGDNKSNLLKRYKERLSS